MIKIIITIIGLLGFVLGAQAQQNSGCKIIRTNLGSSGSSHTIVTSKGTLNVSQSIGQSSVIGTYHNNGYYLRQGYQQPLSNIKVVETSDYNLKAKVYPNPFTHSITISFSDTIRNDLLVMMYDVNGRMVHTQEFSPAQEIQLTIGDISKGTYFLKVTSQDKRFNAKLIKI